MLRAKDPYLTFARALELVSSAAAVCAWGTRHGGCASHSARIGANAHIGPYVVIDEDVEIGANAVLLAHVVIYRGVKIGDNFFAHAHSVVRENCRIGNNVLLQNGVVIGADGFGFAKTAEGRWHKIPQPAPVVIEDDVEVQANSCIDRASVGETRIGRGVKVDNLVQVGHGSHVGEDALLCAQVGLAGSSEIGNRVILTGQVGVVGHCKVGDNAIVTPQSGVAHDIPAGALVSGAPAVDHKLWLKYSAILPRLAGDCAGGAGIRSKRINHRGHPRPTEQALTRRLVLPAPLCHRQVRLRLAILFRQAALDDSSDFLHQAFSAAEILGLDRRMKNHFHQARLDGESRLRHGVVRAHDRHRDHGNAAFDGQIERPFLEGQAVCRRTSACLPRRWSC